MTRETLAFARGDRNLWVRKVYLYKFFEEVADDLRRSLGEKGIVLELQLRDRGIAYFDEEKVQRVLHNLARNAAEAIGDRKGRCIIGVDRLGDGSLSITFEDNGPGIPEAIRERIFESFTSHGKAQGTGLGLAIVQTLVHDHGGQVAVDSNPGRTVFTIRLPERKMETQPPSGERALDEASDRPSNPTPAS
jgi:signal transduction histidine kinase